MIKKIKYSFLIFMLIFSVIAHAQNKKIDSLKNVLKTAKEDTNKVNALNNLAWESRNFNPDSSIILSNNALILAEKINFEVGIGKANHNLGTFNRLKGNYSAALSYNFKALAIWENLGKNAAPNLQSQYAALKSKTLVNLGSTYYSQSDYSKTLDYYFKALKMDQELGNKQLQATSFDNIGNAYYSLNNYSQALDYFFKALAIDEELGNKKGIARHFGNIGNVYKEQAAETPTNRQEKEILFSKALAYYLKALNIVNELGNKQFKAVTLGNIGELYAQAGRFKDSEEYLKEALAIDTTIGFLEGEMFRYKALYHLYDTTGHIALAFEFYKKYIIARDSINSTEGQKKQVRTEMNFEFEKKQSADSIKNSEHIKQEELKHNQEIQQQKIYTYGGAIGFSLMIVVAGVSFRAYRTKQKANEIIFMQKQLVEEKQKEILDSIHYAKRIQQSLLPTEKYIARELKKLAAKN